MKKSVVSLALCGFALFTGAGLAQAASTEAAEGLSAGSPAQATQEKKHFAWEENLKENVAARSIVQEQMTGIPYGVDVLGAPSWEERW